MPVPIAIIGAGSITFARKLVRDLLAVPEFGRGGGITLSLTDIDKANLDRSASLIRREIKANSFPVEVRSTTHRRRALEGARYILNLTRIGGLEAFRHDVEIPLRYGVDQCVGDTLCAGGIFYGQRNIPAILSFCKDIREVGERDALFLNYANPNAMNTWAALAHGNVRTLGLCHGVQHGHMQIASVIEHLLNGTRKPTAKNFLPVTPQEVDIICAGINHQTWYTQIRYNGEDWTPRMLEGFQTHPEFSSTEKVRIDMLRRFGYYSTESNGHLSEYLPWYRKRREAIPTWIDTSEWIHGETGGYLRICTEERARFNETVEALMREEPIRIDHTHRSHEHGAFIIEALETGRTYRGHFNVRNENTITNLPADAIVEVPGYVDGNGISIPRVGALPSGCAAVCNVSIGVQRLAVEAAVTGDVQMLCQAMMLDPLVGAVCTPPEIEAMTHEMLLAHEAWLPQYKTAIRHLHRPRQKECRNRTAHPLKGQDKNGQASGENTPSPSAPKSPRKRSRKT